MSKLSPIGYSDFKEIIEESRYYVDKTAMVRHIVDGSKIQLLCRPRRFGKTLNLSMLRYFFDNQGHHDHLFEGLAVAQDADMMAQHQGKYPVIMLSFKDEKAPNYDSALSGVAHLLYGEWARHKYLVGTPAYDKQLAAMERAMEARPIEGDLFPNAIKDLSILLHAHFGAPVVILIDEYDSPLHVAWLEGYYDELVGFLRRLLGGALKDNGAIFKGVLTGILRVAKESLFSGLNNFVSDVGLKAGKYADKFGFTEAEVAAILVHYGLNGREMATVQKWYDGYRYGGVPIYNPWSIISYVGEDDPTPSPHWVNTGGHDLLKRLFFDKATDLKPSLDVLMRGDTLRAPVDEFLTFRGLETSPHAVLSLLFFAGYLRADNGAQVGYETLYELSVPNEEVMLAYHRTVMSWFREDMGGSFGDPLLDALTDGNAPAFGYALSDFVLRVASYYDTAKGRGEHFYHAFLLGLIARLDLQYNIRSNRESSYGRYDICLLPKDVTKKGIVMEIKSPAPGRNEDLAYCLAAAREQVLARKYDTELAAAGVADIVRMAIAVSGKEVIVEQV